MKELSIEEKAKAYDEAMHKAKRIINVCVDDNIECRSMIACIQQIFPELAESEDEQIRKELIQYFSTFTLETFAGLSPKKIIAWLEKQKDMEAKLIISDEGYSKAFQDGIEEALTNPHKYGLEKQGEQKPYGQRQECADCQFNYAGECKGSCAMKRDEQNPAWSEEDENNLQGIIDEIKANKNQAPAYDLATYNRFLSWLKSLKDRHTWKPSDEQMDVLLSEVTAWAKGCPKQIVLESLYNDLKKLKG